MIQMVMERMIRLMTAQLLQELAPLIEQVAQTVMVMGPAT